MGYIHNCSLRWSLQREGKLDFNSNLRLLTSSRNSRPNAWYSNIVYLTGIVLAYSSTSLIFLILNPNLATVIQVDIQIEHPDANEIHINSVGVMTLGVGLVAQALIATWALVSTSIPTWSSNPLDVVKECLSDHAGHSFVRHRPGRCMMSVHMAKEDRKNCRPISPQKAMIGARHSVNAVFVLLLALPVCAGLWGVVVYLLIAKGWDKNGVFGRSWALLPVFTGYTDTDCAPGLQYTDGTSILNIRWTVYTGSYGTVGSVFVIAGFQSVVTLSLHCAELIVNLSRDEGVYRKLIGPRGTNGHYNSIVAACTSWQTILLFGLKASAHWMFGLAINLSFRLGVNMYPPQIFYFAAFSALTALLGAYLAFRRPSGFLPATYGHIQTIADIIDEWADSGCMYWGHKADGRTPTEPSYAGTSTRRLEPPYVNRWYGGCQQLSQEELAYQIGFQAGSRVSLLNTVGSPPPYQVHRESMASTTHTWDRPSQSSLNSRYSSQSGYSSQSRYSSQSYEPLMGTHYY